MQNLKKKCYKKKWLLRSFYSLYELWLTDHYISATSKVTKSGTAIYEAYISIDEKDMAKKIKN